MISFGCGAAAARSFRCQPAFDVCADRFDRDTPRLAFRVTLQLARVDELVQLFTRDLDRPHCLVRRCHEGNFQGNGVARHGRNVPLFSGCFRECQDRSRPQRITQCSRIFG